MQLSILTLIGFAFTTTCTSICPMGMSMDREMMSMSHSDMQMMHGDMPEKEQQKAPCEKCDHNQKEVVAIAAPAVKIQSPVHSLFSLIPIVAQYDAASLKQPVRLLHSYTRPPPLAESLVGTVILRT